jgi:anti-sigma factor RsiW
MAPWSRSTPCERATQWISLALDDELSGLESAALERHLGRCPECAALARELADTTARLRAAPPVPMRVPVQPGRRHRPRVPPAHRAALGLASLAAVAAAAGVFVFGSPVTVQGPEAIASWSAAQRARALDGVRLGRLPAPTANAPTPPLMPSPFLARARA